MSEKGNGVIYGSAGAGDDQRLLDDVVRHIGQRVAAVVAETTAAAERALRLIRVDYDVLPAVFDPDEGQGYDIILSATLAEPPARVGRFAHATEDYLAYRMGPDGIFAYSPFCAVFNASGQPAASLPLGMAGGLPVGIHLAARFGDDETLLALCAEIERAAPWAHRRPALQA